MSTTEVTGTYSRPLQLGGKTVVVIGGTSGIGFATAQLAQAEGANIILTGRNVDRLQAAADVIKPISTAAFDATDPDELAQFIGALDAPIDHVFVAAGGPYYAPLAEIDFADAHRAFDEHILTMINLARLAPTKMSPGGTLLFMSGTGAKRPAVGLTLAGALSAALASAAANLALEIAPARINLITAGFVDTPLSARLLGNDLDKRRAQLARDLPIGRVVQASDVASLAIHLMTNTAITGAVFDIDGGQQVLPSLGS